MNRKHIPFNCLNICLAEVIFANPMSDVIITIELGLNPRWPTNLENTLLLSQDITRAKEDMEVLKQNIQRPFERSFIFKKSIFFVAVAFLHYTIAAQICVVI